MLGLSPAEPLRRVLAIGCHADDIEIGCGGTLLTLVAANPELEVDWVVLAAPGERSAEARASAEAFLAGAAAARVEVHEFRDGFLPYVGGEVKEVFEDLKRRVDPQLVLTHAGYDFHQDHRLACELTWNTFRDHLILEYEIPKFDGDLGRPNVFVPLAPEVVERKLALLEQHFPRQAGKHWFDRETFLGLMRLRGMEAVAPDAVRRGLHLAQGCARAVRFVPTKLEGAYVVEPERHEDERGFFARTWSGDEFAEHGLVSELSQCSVSRNSKAGTLRGMHFQTRAARGGEARPLHRRRDLRRDRRPEAGVRDAHRVGRRRACSRDRTRALHPEGVRARVPDARRRRRGLLHDLRPLRPRGSRRACAGTTRRSGSTGLRADSRIINERDRSWPDYRPGSLRTRGT